MIFRLIPAALCSMLWAQQFDVATVKLNTSADVRDALLLQPGGRFVATGIPLKMLMTNAYDVRDFEISGGPAWIATDRWNIEARAEGFTDRIPFAQFGPILRALLEDRFQLKVHRETREMPVYVLLPAKSGVKLQANSGEPGPRTDVRRGQLTAQKIKMSSVAQTLSNVLRRPVIDKTGLTGEYDIKLAWAPETGQGTAVGAAPPGPDSATPSDGPTIFTAIQEQLGLRLESQRAPVETVVVDRVEKPSGN